MTKRRHLLLGAVAAVAGCAMRPVAIDRSTMASVKRVGLPVIGFPSSPDVAVINGVGKQFGLVGLISTAVVQGNRSDALVHLMADEAFDPQQYLQEQVTQRLQARSLAVIPAPAEKHRRSFVKDETWTAMPDAVLDVYVSQYGFFAFSDSDDSPYRPGISLSMRLVATQDHSVLMQDQVANTGIDAPVGEGPARTVPPSFTSFSDVTGNPELALSALRLAMAYAADTVVERLA